MPSLTSTISSGMTTAVSQLAENGTTTASTVTTGSIVIGVVVEIVIMLLIIGNLLMVITLLLYKPWTIPDLLLFSLSLADVINGMVPVHILNIMNSFYGQNRWTSGLCALFTWMTFSLRMTSVCTITIISAERMILLTKPLRHHSIVTIKKARIAVIAVWLLSGFLATFPFMGIGRSGFRAGYCFYQLYDLGTAFGVTIETIGIIQLIVVLACFISIKLSSGEFIKRQSVMAATHQTGSSLNLKERETAGTKQVRQLSKMMAIVVLLYYISWLPYLLTNLVSLVYGHLPHAVDILVGFLSLVSAIINPLLYGKMSLRYRRGYQFIFKKIRSLCGGEKPNGNFFDDRRRGSYSTAYSNTIKRGSMGSTAGLEVNQNVNKAYEDDERNHHNNYNSNEDIDEHNPDVQGNEYDNEDIAIYPVEINNKVNHNDNDDNNYGDEDDHDDTQITICPLNESLQFAGNEEGLFNQGASVEDDEREGAGPSTVEEEDFSICPYDESIIAHFEDLRKLADQDENDIIDPKGEITDNENKEKEEVRQTKEPIDSREDGKDTSQSKEIGSPNVANKRIDVDDINIPGTVIDIDEIHHMKKGCDDDDDDKDDDDNDGSDDNDDHASSDILDNNVNHDHHKEKEDSRIEDDDGDGNDVVNGDINPPPMLQQSKTALMPTTTDHQEALLNQGFESDSQSDGGSQDYSDSSGSYGEGSILGNYDITQPEPDTDDEDEDQTCGNNGNDVESKKELNGEEKCTQKEEKKKDEDKGRKEGRKGREETENTRDYVKESKADDENNLTDEENEDEDEEENGEDDSSSKASGETSYDIMGDLLEEETPTIEQQKPHGHFFVDDIVKRMVEDEKQRSSMESYNLLIDGNKHVDEQDKLDKLFENDMSAYGNSTTVKTDIDKKPLAGDCVISKDVATTTTTTTVSRIAEEKNRNKSEIQKQSEGSDHDDFGHSGGGGAGAGAGAGGDESDNAHDDDDSHGDDDEGDDSSDDCDDSGGDDGDGNGDGDNDDDGDDDDDSSNDDVDDDGGEGGGVDDNGDNDGKCGRDGGDDHGVCNTKNGDNNEDVLDSLTHDFQEENEPNFIVDNSIFKKAKPEFSGRKKYTRSTSDLLRKELGEI